MVVLPVGGREGYMSLLNTDQKREKEHLAQMLTIARDYARSKGFTTADLSVPGSKIQGYSMVQRSAYSYKCRYFFDMRIHG